jgi:hypothetical protein
MNVEIEDFKTGWFGISIGMTPQDINRLIKRLESLKQHPKNHFHIFSDCEGDGGVADIEIYLQGADQADNVTLD